MIELDKFGNCLITCQCGYFAWYTDGYGQRQDGPCPSCKQFLPVRKVQCAHEAHNSPDGCGNPHCWKFTPALFKKLGLEYKPRDNKPWENCI